MIPDFNNPDNICSEDPRKIYPFKGINYTAEEINRLLAAIDKKASIDMIRDGLSAYEVAVANGYAGTVDQWLMSLRGPRGEAFQFEDLTAAEIEVLREPANKAAEEVKDSTDKLLQDTEVKVNEVLAKGDAAGEAATKANEAASSATTAAGKANEATDKANEATSKASTAADNATAATGNANAAADKANAAADKATNEGLFKTPQDLSEEEQGQVKQNLGIEDLMASLETQTIDGFSETVSSTTSLKTEDNIIPKSLDFAIVDLGSTDGRDAPDSPSMSVVLAKVPGSGRVKMQGYLKTTHEEYNIQVVEGAAEKDALNVNIITDTETTYKVFQIRYLSSIDSSKFKGSYGQLSELKAAYPTAKDGSYAFVGNPRHLYEWATNAWTDRGEFTTSVDQAIDPQSERAIANKAVAAKLTELDFLSGISYKSKNIVLNVVEGQYVRKEDGELASYPTGKVTDFITIGDFLTVKYSGSYGQISCIAAFYDMNKRFISSIGDSETIKNVTEYSVDLQSVPNAAYVKFSSLNSTFKVLLETDDERYVDIFTIEDDIYNLNDKLFIVESDIEEIKENSGIKSEYNVSNLDVENKPESTYFGMIFDEKVIISSLKYMSETVKTNNKIVVCGPEIEDTKTVIVKTIIPIPDSQVGENTISDINVFVGKGESLFILGNDRYVETRNSNIAEVKNSIGVSGVGTAQVGAIVSYGQKLPVQKAVSITGVLISELTEENIANIVKEYTAESGTNYLNKKKLCVTGDSEAAGHNIGLQNTYGTLIANRNNMTVYNTAVNGRKLAYVEGNPGSGTPLVQAIDEIREDADYILCHIGYNDVFEESEQDDSMDITKYKGAFNTVIEGWQSRYPRARIGIIIPYYFNNDSSRIKRAEWMKQRCEHYHIQYIDGTIKSGLNYDSTEQQELYFLDAVHLTILGHERVSYLYEKFMRGL